MWTHVSNYLFYPHPRENASVIFRKPNAPRPAGVPPPPGRRMTADPAVSQPPRRGRRPRRPAAAASAGLTAFRRPPSGRGMLSRHITRHAVLPAAATRRGRRPRRPFPSSTARPTASHRLRAAGAARKGGTPGEGPPFTPSCASLSMGVFRARRRAARAPPLDPARFFVKKRGKKLLNASLHPTQTPRRGGE